MVSGELIMTSLENKHIFVVEDHMENQLITRLALEDTGAKLRFESWGQETIKRLREFMPVNLILMDLMLPKGLTGYDIFDVIRTKPEFDHIPIIAVSAADSSIAIPKCQKRGFAGFIAKPIDEELFPNQLLDVLNGNAVWYD
mgnify:CR=1 FL=1